MLAYRSCNDIRVQLSIYYQCRTPSPRPDWLKLRLIRVIFSITGSRFTSPVPQPAHLVSSQLDPDCRALFSDLDVRSSTELSSPAVLHPPDPGCRRSLPQPGVGVALCSSFIRCNRSRSSVSFPRHRSVPFGHQGDCASEQRPSVLSREQAHQVAVPGRPEGSHRRRDL